MQRASALCTHSLQAALSRDVRKPQFWCYEDIPDFNDVDYRIWTMLREWVYQQPVRDVDQLRRCLIDTWSSIQQTVIDQTIDQRQFRLRAWVRARGRQLDHLIWCFTFALHYRFVCFILYMMFHCMFETIMMTFKLTWHNWQMLWHVYLSVM